MPRRTDAWRPGIRVVAPKVAILHRGWEFTLQRDASMAEVVLVLSVPVVKDGQAYNAQVCGRPAGHLWEGWIEFASSDGREVLRTARETTQPHRDALDYWATGLSMMYLEAALTRALDPSLVVPRHLFATPHFAGPAPSVVRPDPVGSTLQCSTRIQPRQLGASSDISGVMVTEQE
jgi:hypothetical protein